MKQSENDSYILWSSLVVVFVVVLALGKSVGSETDGTGTRGDAATTPSYLYTGPAGSYAATPHPGSLTYSVPGKTRQDDHTDEQAQKAGEAGKHALTVASGRTRAGGTSSVEK